MTADQPAPGVTVAARAGRCARCGAQYPAGTHARRYGDGLRPVACGCHPVQDRPQTAPTMAPEPTESAAAVVTLELDTTRFEIGLLTAARDALQLELNVERKRAASLHGQAAARDRDLERARRTEAAAQQRHDALRRAVGTAMGLTPAHVHAAPDADLVVLVEQLAGAAAAAEQQRTTSPRPGPVANGPGPDRPRRPIPSAPVSPAGGAPTGSIPSDTPPSATTAPAPVSRPSSPAAPAAAASPASSRSSARPADPPARSLADVGDYATPTSHVCGVAGCGHRRKFHDEDGCTTRRCACSSFEPST